KLLGSSIDYRTTLRNISKSIVPSLADYCRIVLVDENKQISEKFAYHVNPKMIKYVETLYEDYRRNPQTVYGVEHIISTGKSEMMRIVSPQIVKVHHTRKSTQKIIDELSLTS